MIHKNQEIEIKYQLSKKAFLAIKNKLRLITKFIGRSKQIDEYYTPAHRDFLAPKYPFEWLRIRKKKDYAILNYKHWYPENSKIDTHCDEYETEIKSPHELEKILRILNFRSLIIVENKRETYTYKNQLEIALDVVKDLGYFIEIEAMKKSQDINKTRKELFEFAKKLKIHHNKQDLRGYPYNLLKLKGVIK